MNTPILYPCPICKTTCAWQDNPYRPFCSERCRLIDLGAWMCQSYQIPTPEHSDHTEELYPLG